MKITDTAGRVLHIDLVTQQNSRVGWLAPLEYRLQDDPVTYVRMPHGPIALRVMSKHGADVQMFVNGEKVLESTLPGMVQVIDKDSAGKLLSFGPVVESPAHEQSAIGTAESQSAPTPQPVPKGNGLVLVVARLTPENGPGPHPPREEYTFLFQLQAPAEHDENLAGSLRRLVKPEDAPTVDDIVNCKEHNRPKFVCPCTGKH